MCSVVIDGFIQIFTTVDSVLKVANRCGNDSSKNSSHIFPDKINCRSILDLILVRLDVSFKVMKAINKKYFQRSADGIGWSSARRSSKH